MICTCVYLTRVSPLILLTTKCWKSWKFWIISPPPLTSWLPFLLSHPQSSIILSFFSLFPKLYLIFLFSSSFPFKHFSQLLLRVIPFSLHYHSLYYHCYVTPQFTSIFLCFLLSHYISKIQFYLFTLLKQNNDTFYMNIFLNHFFFCIYIHPWNLLWHALDFGSAYLAL